MELSTKKSSATNSSSRSAEIKLDLTPKSSKKLEEFNTLEKVPSYKSSYSAKESA